MDWHSERPFMAFPSNRRRSKQMVPIVWRKSPVVGRFYPVPYSRYVPDSLIIFFLFFFCMFFFSYTVGLTRPVDVDALDRKVKDSTCFEPTIHIMPSWKRFWLNKWKRSRYEKFNINFGMRFLWNWYFLLKLYSGINAVWCMYYFVCLSVVRIRPYRPGRCFQRVGFGTEFDTEKKPQVRY